MKKLILPILALFMLPLFAAWFAMPSAEAAPAECYTVRRASPPQVTKVNCNNVFEAFAKGQGQSGLVNDKCYIVGLAPLMVIAALNNEYCVNAKRNSSGAAAPNTTDNSPETAAGEGSLDNPTRQTSSDCNGGDCINDNYLVVMAKWAINVLSALVGVVVVGVIIFAGIEYSASGGDPKRTGDAKMRIVNAIIALIAYMFLYIALQWLIPGGLFA